MVLFRRRVKLLFAFILLYFVFSKAPSHNTTQYIPHFFVWQSKVSAHKMNSNGTFVESMRFHSMELWNLTDEQSNRFNYLKFNGLIYEKTINKVR